MKFYEKMKRFINKKYRLEQQEHEKQIEREKLWSEYNPKQKILNVLLCEYLHQAFKSIINGFTMTYHENGMKYTLYREYVSIQRFNAYAEPFFSQMITEKLKNYEPKQTDCFFEFDIPLRSIKIDSEKLLKKYPLTVAEFNTLCQGLIHNRIFTFIRDNYGVKQILKYH